MSEETVEWRWADADGVETLVDEWELVSSLSTGELPPYTLVWRKGWGEWLHACQVAELASAMPAGKAETPLKAKTDPLAKEPPKPPLEKYNTYKTREAAQALLKPRGPLSPQTRPPPPPAGGGASASALASLLSKASSAAPPPPPPKRAPMPTLVEQPHVSATVTLRPPGAVPPPPRAMPPSAVSALATPLPNVAIANMESPAPEAVTEPRTLPRAAPAPETPLPTWSDEELSSETASLERHKQALAAAPTPALPYSAMPRAAMPQPPPARFPLSLVILGAIAGLLALVVIVLLVNRRGDTKVTTLDPASSDAAGAAVSNRPCVLSHKPTRLAESIVPGIPPYVAGLDDEHAAVGFAASASRARGLSVAFETLDTKEVFKDDGRRPLLGVVPSTRSGSLKFIADRDDAPLAYARSIDASPPFMLGMSEEGLSLVRGQGKPTVIWPGGHDAKMTEIRVAESSKGHAITFRRRGQSGEILLGWLSPDGAKLTELVGIEPEGRFVGTPVVATNDRAVLVAFAARPSSDAFWGVQLASAPLGEVPRRAKVFSIPPGGQGREAISPAATGLDGGRWLLQWTEGSTGSREVRIQTLAQDLVPIGDPVTVSPKDSNAGQGVVFVRADRALALFLVKTRTAHELWGAALKCP